MNMLRHIGFILCGLCVILGIPFFVFGDFASLLAGDQPDALTGASLEVPASPNGNYYILINKSRHQETDAWIVFFEEKEDAPLIFEDISCMVISSDVNAVQLGDHYKARLAENQMTFVTENPLMTVTKIETSRFDTVIVSADAKERWKLRAVFEDPNVLIITKEVDAE